MVNRSLITAKLAELQERITRVRAHTPTTFADLAANRDKHDLVAFNLMLCLQSCTDIASHIIADEGWTPASSTSMGFYLLCDHGLIEKPIAIELAKAAGLRNIIAHGYAKVDTAKLYAAVVDGLIFVERFAQAISAWVTQAPLNI